MTSRAPSSRIRVDGGRHDAGDQARATAVAAADHPRLGVGEEHHRAVGAAHHQRDARLVGDHAVGACVEVAVEVGARALRADVRDVAAVHLAERGDRVARREVVGEAPVVLGQGVGVVTGPGEVEGVEGRATRPRRAGR